MMATNRQKEAARRNLAKARQAQSARAHGEDIPRRGEGMSTAEETGWLTRSSPSPRSARSR
jgi:hypothetical protein